MQGEGRTSLLKRINMTIDYRFWQLFIFWGKVAGGFIAFGTAVGIVHRTLIGPVFKRVREINDTVSLLATNHLPHIQKSLNDQDVVLSTLKTDVTKASQKIEEFGDGLHETKETVAMLNSALIAHLENVLESAPRKKNAVRVNRSAGVSSRSPRNIG